ncbi:hypothetical protein FOCC_FOCC001197 [Frankliniella occidentalis]|nr:hypothetical protein FOCC_FOCC001197 [Frankliniella occidentalis]
MRGVHGLRVPGQDPLPQRALRHLQQRRPALPAVPEGAHALFLQQGVQPHRLRRALRPQLRRQRRRRHGAALPQRPAVRPLLPDVPVRGVPGFGRGRGVGVVHQRHPDVLADARPPLPLRRQRRRQRVRQHPGPRPAPPPSGRGRRPLREADGFRRVPQVPARALRVRAVRRPPQRHRGRVQQDVQGGRVRAHDRRQARHLHLRQRDPVCRQVRALHGVCDAGRARGVRRVPAAAPARLRAGARAAQPVGQEPGLAVHVAARGLRQLHRRPAHGPRERHHLPRGRRAHLLQLPGLLLVDADHGAGRVAHAAARHVRAARVRRQAVAQVRAVLGVDLAHAGRHRVRRALRRRGRPRHRRRPVPTRVRLACVLVRAPQGPPRVLRRAAGRHHVPQRGALRLLGAHDRPDGAGAALRAATARRHLRHPEGLPTLHPARHRHGADLDRGADRRLPRHRRPVVRVRGSQHAAGPVHLPGLHVHGEGGTRAGRGAALRVSGGAVPRGGPRQAGALRQRAGRQGRHPAAQLLLVRLRGLGLQRLDAQERARLVVRVVQPQPPRQRPRAGQRPQPRPRPRQRPQPQRPQPQRPRPQRPRPQRARPQRAQLCAPPRSPAPPRHL